MLIKNVLKKLANTAAAAVLVLSQTLAYSAGFFITNPALAGALTSASIVPTTTVAPNNWNTNTVANIQTSNNVYVSEVGGGSQGYSGFDFSIPAGSVIDGIEITVEAKSSTGVACRLGVAASVDGGATYSSTTYYILTDSDLLYTFGGLTNTLGFSALTEENVSVSNFVIQVTDNDPGTDCDNEAEIFVDTLSAKIAYSEEQKYDICHATNAANNPYNSISVSKSAVDGAGNGDHYVEHTGPVAETQATAQQLKDTKTSWGDIIPPVTGAHSGLNWTAAGQTIWQNDCEVPEDDQPVVDYCNPAQKPGGMSIFQWLTAQNPVPQCVDYDVDVSVCGQLKITLTKNDTPYNYGFSYSEDTVEWNFDTDASTVTFTEDYNGGSVDVYYWGVGAEKDYFTALGFPWYEVEAEMISVNTNCEADTSTLYVTKTVNNTNGGVKMPDEFAISVNGNELSGGVNVAISETLTARTFAGVELPADTAFAVTETLPSGYTQTSLGCFYLTDNGSVPLVLPFTPPAGVLVYCNIQNQDNPGSVTVNKQVENNWGGTLGADNFTLFIKQLGGQVETTGNGSVQILLAAGQYQVGENDVAGYELFAFSGDCDVNGVVTVVVGGEVSCTLENRDVQPTLNVTKRVINDNGGEVLAEEVDVYVNGALLDDARKGGGDVSDSSVTYLHGGTRAGVEYSVSEEVGLGYEASDVSCVDVDSLLSVDHPVTLSVGQKVDCTITNDDKAPVIEVSKLAYPCMYYNTLLTKLTSEEQVFSFEISGAQELQFDLIGTCEFDTVESITEVSLPQYRYTTEDTFQAGEFSITEEETLGWYQTGANCYDVTDRWNLFNYNGGLGTEFTTEIGHEYECEFENYEYGQVTVTKYHDYNENGEWDDDEPTLEDWEIVLSESCSPLVSAVTQSRSLYEVEECEAETIATQKTEEDGTTTFEELEVGLYEVNEILQDGWVQSSIYCEPFMFEREPVNLEHEIVELPGQIFKTETNEFFMAPGQEQQCYVGNYREPVVAIDKTNDTTGPIQRNTEVTFTLTVKVPPADNSGILQGAFDDDEEYQPVVVNDNLTDEFDYVSGSFTATSNIRGDLKAAGITTDPNYESPGVWILTTPASNEIMHNEVITLTYKAIVGNTVPAGTYPTTASVIGYGDTVDITATDQDDDQVVVFVPAVLGAVSSPVEPVAKKLVSTGSHILTNILIASGLIGLALALRRKSFAA
jgi:hypothetical protein